MKMNNLGIFKRTLLIGVIGLSLTSCQEKVVPQKKTETIYKTLTVEKSNKKIGLIFLIMSIFILNVNINIKQQIKDRDNQGRSNTLTFCCQVHAYQRLVCLLGEVIVL